MPSRTEAPPEAVAEGFDQPALMRQVGSDRELLMEIVTLLLQTAPRLLSGIRAAVGRGDGSGLQAATRARRKAAREVGAPQVEQAALVLEEMGDHDALHGAPVACAALERELARWSPSLLATMRAVDEAGG